jgi:alginate O-acetyltransferase complex protein AlgJ
MKDSSHRFAAGFTALLLIAGLAWGAYALPRSGLGASQLAPSAWLDGSAGTRLNKALQLPAQSRIDTWNAALRYKLFGGLGDQVVQGCPGWLFYLDGLRPQPGNAKAFEQRISLMQLWIAELRRAGVQTLVVAVPDKSRVQSDQLCGLQASAAMQRRLDAWEDALRAQGVPYVDLRDALDQARPAFFKTDVHMNARGASAATKVLADAALPMLGGPGSLRYAITTGAAPVARVGDLIVLAGLEQASGKWRPAPDQVVPQTVTPLRSMGLLDDAAPAEVLLAGSSNGRRSNFAELLGMRLGRDVWNMSMDGGQFSGALLEALKQRDKWPHSLKLVIWEFSEMSLSLPLTNDEQQALSALD